MTPNKTPSRGNRKQSLSESGEIHKSFLHLQDDLMQDGKEGPQSLLPSFDDSPEKPSTSGGPHVNAPHTPIATRTPTRLVPRSPNLSNQLSSPKSVHNSLSQSTIEPNYNNMADYSIDNVHAEDPMDADETDMQANVEMVPMDDVQGHYFLSIFATSFLLIRDFFIR